MWVQTPWRGYFRSKISFFMYNTIIVYILRVPVSMKGSKGHQKSRKQRKQTGFKELAHICVLCSAIASPSLLSSSPIRVNPKIREGLIQTEQACLQWLEDEERVDAPNQKLEDLWSIPLPLERGELRVREWNRYIRRYRRSLKLVEDWNEAIEIRHLLKDVLPGHWKRRVEDEEKKRAKKGVAVRIMASEDTHAGIKEFFWRNLGDPSRMLGLKNAVYVEVFGNTMGQRLMRLNNAEWRRGEPLRMQVIFARMSLDEIVKYIKVVLKLNAKNEAHVQDPQGHGHRGHREDRGH